MKCPKCGGTMSDGFILDDAHGGLVQSRWTGGPPVKSWLGIRVKKKDRVPVTTWRCSKCGFLESYALSE
jgi:ribosomal protein S27AE